MNVEIENWIKLELILTFDTDNFTESVDGPEFMKAVRKFAVISLVFHKWPFSFISWALYFA